MASVIIMFFSKCIIKSRNKQQCTKPNNNTRKTASYFNGLIILLSLQSVILLKWVFFSFFFYSITVFLPSLFVIDCILTQAYIGSVFVAVL